jgi:hypothetical protein
VRDIKSLTNKNTEYLPFRLFVISYRLVIVVATQRRRVDVIGEEMRCGYSHEMTDFNVRRSGGSLARHRIKKNVEFYVATHTLNHLYTRA